MRSARLAPPRPAGELEQVRSGQADLKALFASKGLALASNGEAYMIPAAEAYRGMNDASSRYSAIGAILISLAGAYFGLSGITLRRRARNNVERVMLWALIAASTVAILTTIGIVLSMLFQTLAFFRTVPLANFFFERCGTRASPRPDRRGTGHFGSSR